MSLVIEILLCLFLASDKRIDMCHMPKEKNILKIVGDGGLAKFLISRCCSNTFFTFICFVYLLIIDSAFEPTYQFLKNRFRLPRMLSDSFNQLCLKTNRGKHVYRFCLREESRRWKADLCRKEVERSLLFSSSQQLSFLLFPKCFP